MKIKFTCIENLCLVMAVPEKLFKKLSIINQYHAANLYVLHSTAIFIDLICRITVTIMYLQAEWKILNRMDSDQLASQKITRMDIFQQFIYLHLPSLQNFTCLYVFQALCFNVTNIIILYYRNNAD